MHTCRHARSVVVQALDQQQFSIAGKDRHTSQAALQTMEVQILLDTYGSAIAAALSRALQELVRAEEANASKIAQVSRCCKHMTSRKIPTSL